jgi:hypothetical protein
VKLQDLAGERFGRWIVLRWAGKDKHRNALWLCRCDCGKERVVTSNSLRTGHTKSCGCLSREIAAQRQHKHGHARRNETPEYRTWKAMLTRCCNPHAPNYPDYGGRGITVCDRCRDSFGSFLEDMGEKPEPKHLYSIDRINNEAHYEPGNCRWATWSEQMRNRRPANEWKRAA